MPVVSCPGLQPCAFPTEVISEAWENRANLPALLWQHLPSLLETVNIAAAPP